MESVEIEISIYDLVRLESFASASGESVETAVNNILASEVKE